MMEGHQKKVYKDDLISLTGLKHRVEKERARFDRLASLARYHLKKQGLSNYKLVSDIRNENVQMSVKMAKDSEAFKQQLDEKDNRIKNLQQLLEESSKAFETFKMVQFAYQEQDKKDLNMFRTLIDEMVKREVAQTQEGSETEVMRRTLIDS